MDQPCDANPSNIAGERNLLCPYYPFCLDMAAANMWPCFTCDYCFYRKTKAESNINDMDLSAPGWEDIWGGAG